VTVDEELGVLDHQLRRLKIEYEIYFNNPTKKPPTDIEWKVLSLLRKFADSSRLSFSQRFRYNELAQRYAIFSDLWRKKRRIREEGYRRPQDALLSVQGVRLFADGEEEERVGEYEINEPEGGPQEAMAAAAAAVAAPTPAPATALPGQPYTAQFSDADRQRPQVESLYQALVQAKKNAGESLSGATSLESFNLFVKNKTAQLRKQYHCEEVEYSVEVEAGKVKLKAKAKT
jgi:hypothetical protein